MDWVFDLGQKVKMSLSQETGVVIGRAHYTEGPPAYYVRYLAGDGRQVEAWWQASAIKAAT